jgi:Brp/Blh family beta-carotene 15,15'-monooxygenase
VGYAQQAILASAAQLVSLAMNTLRRQGLLFSIVALTTALLSVVWMPLNPQHELWLASLLIVLLGVPHGALDPIFAQTLLSIKSRLSWIIFVVVYVFFAALVVVIWWFVPVLFLLIFLSLSVLHFSGDLAAGASFLSRFFYAGAVIVLPAALHAEELDRLFSLLAGPSAAALVLAALQFMAWPWLAALVWVVVKNARYDSFLALEILAVSVLALSASPLLAFSIFFCFMHSPRHILRTQLYAGVTLRGLARVTITPMFAVLVMAAAGWYGLPDAPIDERIVQLVFVALAALTVPHMMLVERVRLTGWQQRTQKIFAAALPR